MLHVTSRSTPGAGNLGLLGIAVHTELRGDHPERVDILLVVDEDRHVAIEVGDPPLLFTERQQWRDMGNAVGKERELNLRHGISSGR